VSEGGHKPYLHGLCARSWRCRERFSERARQPSSPVRTAVRWRPDRWAGDTRGPLIATLRNTITCRCARNPISRLAPASAGRASSSGQNRRRGGQTDLRRDPRRRRHGPGLGVDTGHQRASTMGLALQFHHTHGNDQRRCHPLQIRASSPRAHVGWYRHLAGRTPSGGRSEDVGAAVRIIGPVVAARRRTGLLALHPHTPGRAVPHRVRLPTRMGSAGQHGGPLVGGVDDGVEL
jgi:hypothetical protein